ncbi:MAG: DNA translocase FtsK 4TM domain-containing protein [Myxococcales bacterium]|nr:DNA translocase FtsK 4TM domain-containing protein [Myxococcales bacterium]USN51343.1 MAG: DNA translocase FtsK 4TM domain-containing protein [Myxococcales bacterium]
MKKFLKGEQETNAAQKKIIIKELCGIISFALSFMLFLSIATYSSADNLPGLNEHQLNNWLGPVGAKISAVLVNYVGILSVILPLTLLLFSIKFIFDNPSILNAYRATGITFILLGIAPILSFFSPALGGRLGIRISAFFMSHLFKGGLFVVALSTIFAGVVLIVDRPLIAKGFYRISAYIRLLFQRFKEKRKEKATHVVVKYESLSNIERAQPRLEQSHQDKESFISEPEQAATESSTEIAPIMVKSPTFDSDIHIIERDRKKDISAIKRAEKDNKKKDVVFSLPPLKLLNYDAPTPHTVAPDHFKKEAERLQRAFLQFGIEGKIREIRPGPVVTNYEFVPAPGIKLSRIAALSDDIAMAMSAVHVRIVTPIPGKGAVGIEVPNDNRETVFLKEIVANDIYRSQPGKLCMAIGKNVEGDPYFMNLADMPHVLIAGTTGSGKSVSVNAMICSILYRATPAEVRFLMIDPKMLELSIYNGIPHLLLPPIIEAKKAANALKWAVKEMDQRYELMKEAAVRDISTYNEKIKTIGSDHLKEPNGRKHEQIPYLVIVVDEYADLLAVAGKEVEGYIMRLAQKARAAGIHVMLATQRPSVDVITGVIKANFPVRMGFRLASSHDSKTIINKTGAEKLLGKGDVLIIPPGTSDVTRVHGAFISEKELVRVVDFLKSQHPCEYNEEIANFEENSSENMGDSIDNSEADEKLNDAIAIVREYQKCSTSFLQRHLCVGYNRAARIVEHMEKAGLVGPVLNAKGEREIFLDQ